MSRRVTVLNGPGLGQLGTREPGVYGDRTQDELAELLLSKAGSLGLELGFGQFDGEGDLIAAILAENGRSGCLIVNPAAYSHYSLAVMDALRAFDGKVIEVHISQVLAREEFRKKLVTAEAADAFIAGMGFEGYLLALEYASRLLAAG
ncbi:3-dehydroquinate dehydratase [Candidatus Fermentibacterales bacterium]|nr:3-dehydroquinate dehydratase [Candidatus Fermentibacterales bacterium]